MILIQCQIFWHVIAVQFSSDFFIPLTIINGISKAENCIYAVLNMLDSPFFIIDDLLAVFEGLLLYIQILIFHPCSSLAWLKSWVKMHGD